MVSDVRRVFCRVYVVETFKAFHSEMKQPIRKQFGWGKIPGGWVRLTLEVVGKLKLTGHPQLLRYFRIKGGLTDIPPLID